MLEKFKRARAGKSQEALFADRGSVAEIFTDLRMWQEIRKVIEETNANAAA